jgi:maleylacetoacetate isomerase
MSTVILYDYWRSSASYRVRIALHLCGIEFENVSVDLLKGEHGSPEHIERNPQGFVPVLEIDGLRLTQSLAIIEYIHETRPARLLPAESVARARVRALAHVIAMETHPVCNPSVVARVLQQADVSGDDANAMRADWMKHFIRKGLQAFERLLDDAATGEFCDGDTPGLADLCLVPQVYNAHRWGTDISDLSRVRKISKRCEALDAFAAAHPDQYEPKT